MSRRLGFEKIFLKIFIFSFSNDARRYKIG